MNFVKGKDEVKKTVACIGWFLVVFACGFLASLVFFGIKVIKIEEHSWYYLPALVGGAFYFFNLILNVSIKNIKAGIFEVKSKDSESKDKNKSEDNYKCFYYGIEPYLRNKLALNLNSKLVKIQNQNQELFLHENDFTSIQREIHNSEKYHKCELMVYETLANRRFWSIFCPFIGTEVLTLEEVEDIIRSCK